MLNLRYKTLGDYERLDSKQIKEILELAKTKDKITYKDIAKVINKSNIVFKDNKLSKKDYAKCIDEFKKKYDIEKFDFNELTDEAKNNYNELLNKKKLDNVFGELKTYSVFRKNFTKWNKE